MMEVSRREKEEGIVPDPDIDTYMKVFISWQIFLKVITKSLFESILGSNKILAGNISRRTKKKSPNRLRFKGSFSLSRA